MIILEVEDDVWKTCKGSIILKYPYNKPLYFNSYFLLL